jgi:alkylated DNA nucleotide flippase Atl1
VADGLPSPYAERVLDLVERVPPGYVVTYGDVAAYLGEGGPRQVGRVMALFGGGVPWWRVVRASGEPAQGHEREALRRLRSDGAPLVRQGSRVDLGTARWDPSDPRGVIPR